MLATELLSELATLPPWAGGASTLLLKATIVLGASAVVTRAMPRAPAGARHLVWLVALGTLLALPALATWTRFEVRLLPPATALPTPSAAAVSVATRQPRAPVADRGTAATRSPMLGADATPSASERRPTALFAVSALRPFALIAAIWAAVALLVLASLARSSVAVRRIVRGAHPLEEPAWRTSLIEVADRLGLDEPPRLLASPDTTMPFACGVFAPTVVLPAESAGWAADRRQAVLLHELAHVRRRDVAGHLLGRIVCALYWFHPLVWSAAKQLRTESERACDDLALDCGTRASDYAEHLLDIVTAVRRHTTPAAALAMARRSEFEGRMLAILDPELRRATLSRRQSAALVVVLALSAGLVAAVAPVPRAAAASPAVQAGAASPAAATTAATPSPARAALPQAARSTVAQSRASAPAPAPSAAPTDAADQATTATRATTPSASQAQAPDPDDRPALLAKVLRADASASLRRIAAWGLEQYADSPSATDALVNAVAHDADARVREMAAWSLGSAENDHRVADALSAALRQDASESVRATAAWALGSTNASAAAGTLAAALSDSSRAVRMRAAWALGNVGVRQAPPALLALLRDHDAETRQLAAWALYQIEDPSAVPALASALHGETDEETELAFVRAIAVNGDNSVDALRGLLESPDARIKSMAVRALAGGHATGPWPWPWPEPRPEP